MAYWKDQQSVIESNPFAHFHMGDGLSVEIESIVDDNSVPMYRLTIGNLFSSESVRFAHTQAGLEELIKTVDKIKKAQPNAIDIKNVDGSLEPRESEDDRTD